MTEIKIPEFWKSIEKKLSIDSDGIKLIKDVLSLLNYTTIQSITKFTKPKEIKLIELEFMNRKKEFIEQHPHLKDFTFGSGTVTILHDIATQIKKKFSNGERDDIDYEEISQRVLSDGQKVFFVYLFFVDLTYEFKVHVVIFPV